MHRPKTRNLTVLLPIPSVVFNPYKTGEGTFPTKPESIQLIPYTFTQKGSFLGKKELTGKFWDSWMICCPLIWFAKIWISKNCMFPFQTRICFHFSIKNKQDARKGYRKFKRWSFFIINSIVAWTFSFCFKGNCFKL